MKLFLDDEREIGTTAPKYVDATWVHVRTADEAIALLRTGKVEEASLDHDLGHCPNCDSCKGYADRRCACRCHLTGYFVVCWMETEGIWPPGGVRVHSANPGGALKMRLAIDRHYSCVHERVAPATCDQTLAVVCLGCNMQLAACWADEHIPESLWNRACQNSRTANPCEKNRDDVCAICGEGAK